MQYKRFLKTCLFNTSTNFFCSLSIRHCIYQADFWYHFQTLHQKLWCRKKNSFVSATWVRLHCHLKTFLILSDIICISRTINSSVFFKKLLCLYKGLDKVDIPSKPLIVPFFLGNFIFLYLQFDLYLLKIIKRSLFQYFSPNFDCIFKFFDFFDSFYFSSEVVCSKCMC